VLLLLGLGIYVYWFSVARLEPEAKIYVVAPGTSLKAFARQLRNEKVLPDANTLVWIAYLKGQSRDLKTGEYRFRKGITALEILEQVMSGRVVEYPLTITEGWTFKQTLEALAAAPKLTHILQDLKPKQIMASLGYPTMHPEGRFYPDTYYYSAGMSDLIILQRAFQKMEKVLEEEWNGRQGDLPIKTRDEALTLASIVEKETGKAEERASSPACRAAVTHRHEAADRSDRYLWDWRRFNGNLTVKDLHTGATTCAYVIKGLPPTPSLAGLTRAACHLNPENTRRCISSRAATAATSSPETYEQHNRAVTNTS
jgi:UPF0755 protein